MKTRQAKKILKEYIPFIRLDVSPYSRKTLRQMLKVMKRKKNDFFTASAITFIETKFYHQSLKRHPEKCGEHLREILNK